MNNSILPVILCNVTYICLCTLDENQNHHIHSPIALFVCFRTDKESFAYRIRRTAG